METTVFFVGIHNKPGMKPLDSQTMSGKIIDGIIKELPFKCVKTNLCEIEYMPTDWNQINEAGITWGEKYPRKKTDIVVLLGAWVHDNFFWNDCKIVKLPHPASFISRVNKENYIKKAIDKINEQLDPLMNRSSIKKSRLS